MRPNKNCRQCSIPSVNITITIGLKFHQVVGGLSQYFRTTKLDPDITEHAYLKNKAGRDGVLKVDVCLGQNFMIEDVRRRSGILAPLTLDNPISESNSTLMEHKNSLPSHKLFSKGADEILRSPVLFNVLLLMDGCGLYNFSFKFINRPTNV